MHCEHKAQGGTGPPQAHCRAGALPGPCVQEGNQGPSQLRQNKCPPAVYLEVPVTAGPALPGPARLPLPPSQFHQPCSSRAMQ